MRRILALALALSALMLFYGCGKKAQPVEEVKPAEETKTEEPTETKPETPPEPEIKKLSEADFKVVYFDFDKYNLVDSAKRALDYNAQLLKDNPSVIVQIEGHCDERGTVEYNISLGEKRAMSAKTYLINLGIDANRLQTISYGKERPVAFGHDEISWAKNRRDEFVIVSQ
jgi:peptidoglycan-associated lipoprotein